MAEISVTYCGCPHYDKVIAWAPDWVQEVAGAGTSGRELKGVP